MFEAMATAYPGTPEYEWTGPGGRELPKNRTRRVNGGNLELLDVQKSDEGFYRVTATANGETTSHMTHLAVYGEFNRKSPSTRLSIAIVYQHQYWHMIFYSH